MNAQTPPYAGLILPTAAPADLASYLDAAERAVLRHDPSSAGSRRLEHKSCVLGLDYGLNVSYREDGDYGPMVTLKIVTRKGFEICEDTATQILSDAVLFALDTSTADIIEWCAPGVILDSADFIRLRSIASPQYEADSWDAEELELTHSFRDALEEPDEAVEASTLDRLKARVQQVEPADLRMSAASAAMTVIIAVASMPIAAAIAVINLGRGFDFRRTTQALSITALFLGLNQGFGVNNELISLFLN